MTMIAARFCVMLAILLTAVSSQTDQVPNEETGGETHISDTDLPDDRTLTSITVIDENASGNGTELAETSWTSEENPTTETSATHTVDDGPSITGTTTPCVDQICENGGTCVSAAYGSDDRCLCPNNYVGTKCETLDNCTTDDDGIRCTNGACVYGQGRKYRYCKCFLGQYWHPVEAQCLPPQEPCFPNPCLSGGICTEISTGEYECTCEKRFSGKNCETEDMCAYSESGIQCENGYCAVDVVNSRRSCKCIEGFYLDPSTMQCRKISPPCEPNPCINNGLCTAVSGNKYNCSCRGEYVGDRCEILNRCQPDSSGEVCKNGICRQEGIHSRRCFCNEAYYLDENGNECKEISPPCEPNPCHNGGFCKPTSLNEFNCSCLDEFYGKQCDIVDTCISEGNEFCRSAQCQRREDNDGYICQCSQGQYFDYGSRECKLIDLCPLLTLKENAACKNNRVTCFKDFKENNETGLCEPNFCETKGCPAEGMICEENVKDPENYKCFCNKGYSFDGKACNLASCAVPGLNNCDQICEEGNHSFVCKCNEPFTLGPDNRTCGYSGNMTCLNTTCKVGHCIIRKGEEICVCPPGHEEHNGECIDKCSAGSLPLGVCPDNRCETTPSGFRCKCEGRYKFSPDNVTCTVRQLCSENEHGWKLCSRRNASCVNVWNEPQGFVCRCPPGTVKMDDGACREICAVEENKKKCSLLGGVCSLDTNFDFTCSCPPSFQQTKEGAPCNKLAKFSYLVTLPVPPAYYAKKPSRQRTIHFPQNVEEHKLWNDVTTSMQELYEAFENANILQCSSTEDFLLCTIEFQFRETNLENLERFKIPASCVSNEERNDNLCLIPPALVLRRDKIQSHVSFDRADPCSQLIKSSLCESSTDCASSQERRSFACTCKSGFSAHRVFYPLEDTKSVIEMCSDIDECAESDPCPKSSTVCSNTIGSYSCFCRSGYRTINDSSDPKKDGCVHLCYHTPCLHGTCAVKGDHKFECRCEPGFSGVLCDTQDKNYKDARTNTIIVGAVLGGTLLIVLIVFLSKIHRRNRKFPHESGQLILGSTELTERRPIRGGIFNDGFERE